MVGYTVYRCRSEPQMAVSHLDDGVPGVMMMGIGHLLTERVGSSPAIWLSWCVLVVLERSPAKLGLATRTAEEGSEGVG